MKRDRALPFRTLHDQAVKVTPWACAVNGAEPQYSPSQLLKWDYASILQIWRRVEVDFEAAARCLEIPKSELKLHVGVSLGTGPGSMPRWATQVESILLSSDAPASEVKFSVSSNELSTRIVLATDFTLAEGHTSTSPLSPKTVGARLWRDDLDISIEGEAPRFPISNISFRSAFAGRRHAASPWYVHWSTIELDRDLAGALRLFVNSDNSAFSDRIDKLDEPTLQAIMYDVMNQVIGRFLDAELDEKDARAFEPGSVGRQAEQWMALAFPGQSLEQVRSLRTSRPGDYAGAVFSAAEMGEL